VCEREKEGMDIKKGKRKKKVMDKERKKKEWIKRERKRNG
jgi:hypothetical protein